MSRFFPDLPESDGHTFRLALNAILQAIRSMFSGAGRASNPVVGQINHDTSTDLLEFFGASSVWQTLLSYANAVKLAPWAFTSTGTAPSLVLTPSPALAAYGSGAGYLVKFHVGSATTLNISGLGARNLKQYNAAGAKIAAVTVAGMRSLVIDDGTDLVLLTPLTPALPSLVNTFNTRAGAVVLTAADVTGVGGALAANIITSFNTRIGAVTLSSADISGAGGAMADNVVNSLNGRKGILTLTSADVTGALTFTPLDASAGLSSTAADIKINGTQAAGSSTKASKADHVHPVDTSRAAVAQVFFIGTTSVAINRASAALVLTGITSIDGLAATATILATARAINGVNFNGSAPITVPLNTADDTATNATMYPVFTTGVGNIAAKIATTKYTFNPSTGALGATSFNGITGLATADPVVEGTAAVGVSTKAAREDHVHPAVASQDTLWHGSCQMTLSAGNLLLLPYGGNGLSIGGTLYAIPEDGVTLAPTGLTPDTVYYIYAYMNGEIMTLEPSTTGYAANGSGIKTKVGDETRTLVGQAFPITGPAFYVAKNYMYVRSWFNRSDYETSPRSLQAADLYFGASSVSYYDTGETSRVAWLSWRDESTSFINLVCAKSSGTGYIRINLNGAIIGSSTVASSSYRYYINGTSQIVTAYVSNPATDVIPYLARHYSILPEGRHQTAVTRSCVSGSMTLSQDEAAEFGNTNIFLTKQN